MDIEEQSNLLIKIILQDAKKKQDELISKFELEAEEIKKMAIKAADVIKSKSQKGSFSSKIKTLSTREISKAELKSKFEIANYKEEMLGNILSNIQDLLSKISSDEQYLLILKNLIIDGIKRLKGFSENNFILYLSHEDSKLIDNKLLAEIKNYAGGTLVIETKDSSIVTGVLVRKDNEPLIYDNSLNGIMKRERDNLFNMANNMLWSEIS